jgi:hypothetical protein
MRVPSSIVDIFCVSDFDSSAVSSGSNIAIACLKALRACIFEHPPSKMVSEFVGSVHVTRITAARSKL